MRFPLFVFRTRPFLQPPVRHEERFFIPQIVFDFYAATRNEDVPDLCDVITQRARGNPI